MNVSVVDLLLTASEVNDTNDFIALHFSFESKPKLIHSLYKTCSIGN